MPCVSSGMERKGKPSMKVIDLQTWEAKFALDLGATWDTPVRLARQSYDYDMVKMAILKPVNPSAHKPINTWVPADDIEIEEIYLIYDLVYTSSEAKAVCGGYGPKSNTFILYRGKE